MEFKLIDVLNKTDKFISFISDYKNVVYRFYCIKEDKSYIGITNNLIYRLYSEDIGHLTKMNDCDSIHGSRLQNAIAKFGVDNFNFSIEYYSDSYEEIDCLESEYIRKYNSCFNGYNCSTSGKMCDGDIRVNNGIRCVFIKPHELDEAKLNGFNRIGSLSSSRITVTNGKYLVIIYKDEFNEFEKYGFCRIDHKSTMFNSLNSDYDINDDYGAFINQAIINGMTPERSIEYTNFTISGKVGYTDLLTGKYFLVDPSEEVLYQDTSRYYKGNLNMNLKKDQVFVTKDGINKRIDRSELQDYLDDNWVRGFKKRNTGVKMHLGDIEISVPKDLVETYESYGYSRGVKKTRNVTLLNLETGDSIKLPRSEIEKINELKSDGWVSNMSLHHPPSGKGCKYEYINGKKTRINK